MVARKANPKARIFAVKGDIGTGDEFALHDVLTWPKIEDAAVFCAGTQPGRSRSVIIAERGDSFEGGMTMTIGADDTWPVALADDRVVMPFKDHEVLSVLVSVPGIKGTQVWVVRPEVIGHIRFTPQGYQYVAHKLSL